MHNTCTAQNKEPHQNCKALEQLHQRKVTIYRKSAKYSIYKKLLYNYYSHIYKREIC